MPSDSMPSADLRSYPLVILGAGYAGQYVFALARAKGWDTFATSRAPATHLLPIPSSHRIEFDLHRQETWCNIPDRAHLIWCFPAVPQDPVTHFLENRLATGGRLILLGSTSAYGPDLGRVVNEQTPPRLTLPRVKSEEYLRARHGAIILRLAGLYGPGRHVLDWMRKGKVKNTDRYVNLIHIQDVAGICLTALEKATPGEVYLVSDGIPRQWSEIFRTAHERWGVPLPSPSKAKDSGKQLSNHKLRVALNYRLRFPDLYQALDDIEQQRPDSRALALPKKSH